MPFFSFWVAFSGIALLKGGCRVLSLVHCCSTRHVQLCTGSGRGFQSGGASGRPLLWWRVFGVASKVPVLQVFCALMQRVHYLVEEHIGVGRSAHLFPVVQIKRDEGKYRRSNEAYDTRMFHSKLGKGSGVFMNDDSFLASP